MRICLVGATHPCHSPRLVREADSLAEAGHDVRVVAPSIMPELREKDARLLAKRIWQLDSVDYCPTGLSGVARAFIARGSRRLSHELFKLTHRPGLAEIAYTPALRKLISAAVREPADWFIAHAHGALPIAASAAKQWKARLGFDCEDLLSELGIDPPEIVREIERRYLRNCDYISVPSASVAERLAIQHNIKLPIVLYNVFPLILAQGMLEPNDRLSAGPLRLHWFGQTIGPGRGIEEAIEACGMLGDGAEIHLRGNPSEGYDAILRALASQHNANLQLYPQLDHDDLIKAMDQFDVGLALERSEHTNFALTVTNKIGSYLLAGLAIAATDTPGQREILEQIPSAGFLYPSGKPKLLAEGLRKWLADRNALKEAQQPAWDAARIRFCWDIEKEELLGALL